MARTGCSQGLDCPVVLVYPLVGSGRLGKEVLSGPAHIALRPLLAIGKRKG
jgi:hypothetical protein